MRGYSCIRVFGWLLLGCLRFLFLEIYFPSAKKSELPSHQDLGVFALEVKKSLQATPPKLRRDVGTVRQRGKPKKKRKKKNSVQGTYE